MLRFFLTLLLPLAPLTVDADPALLARFQALAEGTARSISATGLLRGTPELVILDPASRSRLRWL